MLQLLSPISYHPLKSGNAHTDASRQLFVSDGNSRCRGDHEGYRSLVTMRVHQKTPVQPPTGFGDGRPNFEHDNFDIPQFSHHGNEHVVVKYGRASSTQGLLFVRWAVEHYDLDSPS